MVTTDEKAKRRRKRGPKRPGTPCRRMHHGADNAYKEFKIATFYDPSNPHRHVVAEHQRLRSPKKRQALQALIGYVGKRLNQCDYPRYATEVGPIEAMMALIALEQSNARKTYWEAQSMTPKDI